MEDSKSLSAEAKGKFASFSDPSRKIEKLYHYTTAEGLIGILSTGRLWATDLDYLNDASEYVYGKHVLDRVLAKQKWASYEVEKLLSTVMTYDPRLIWDPYVTCFCDKGDLLSQWRAYSGNGIGYALEMDAQFFSEFSLASEDILFDRIEYTLSRQKRLLSAILDQLASEIRTPALESIRPQVQ